VGAGLAAFAVACLAGAAALLVDATADASLALASQRREKAPAAAGAEEARTAPGRRTAEGFETVAGDDWSSYASVEALKDAEYFWWFDDRDVYRFVELVPDPLFGRVLRITFPQNQGSPGSSPRMAKRLPAPLSDLWLRWKVRFTPGWTTHGPDPAGAADSYKLAFFTWDGPDGRGELQFSNGTDYITGVSVRDPTGGYYPFTETLLPGASASFGQVTTEWTDGEWWEYVIHYRVTAPEAARFQYWRRRLTERGRVQPGPWSYHGMEMRGWPVPRVAKVELGANKNKSNPRDLSLSWGPWEVVDGTRYPYPFGVPHAR
jgi:hypothetical protein